ncbi:MAG: hypothetical protein KGL11_03995 [Alphaproteobacteria bacterium]|nr:hypothetical protein [Alphaproteobacteria bacterium]
MVESLVHARRLRAAFAALAALALAAAVLAIVPAAAAPGPGAQPYYGAPIPVPPFLANPFAPRPEPPFARSCDGSEPIFGGILGATAGGLLAAALGEDHGRVDPGATVFGVVAGAMVGATLAASHCPND